jgi:RNA polymerase sigma factor (TIGR02999 family)
MLPKIYQELRRLAARFMAEERKDHTLQPTALVHEAYLRLARREGAEFEDRAHFFRAAATAMRRVLANHARDRGRLKRGGGRPRVSLDDVTGPTVMGRRVDFLALDEALVELERLDPRKSQVVELHYFGGLEFEEIGGNLEISLATVKRDWAFARAWLLCRLEEEESHGG